LRAGADIIVMVHRTINTIHAFAEIIGPIERARRTSARFGLLAANR